MMRGIMSNYIQAIAVLFATIVCMSPTGGAVAAEIKVLSTLGMKEVLDELGPRFERATGHKLAITFDSSGGVVKRIQGGQAS
jgi:molybdate transport system substrate-binding protein